MLDEMVMRSIFLILMMFVSRHLGQEKKQKSYSEDGQKDAM